VIAVDAGKNKIVVSIPTEGMPAEAVSAFVSWLRVEAAARRSSLTPETALKLSEEIKSDWWSQNQSRLNGRE
jgi:hypothetical protein